MDTRNLPAETEVHCLGLENEKFFKIKVKDCGFDLMSLNTLCFKSLTFFYTQHYNLFLTFTKSCQYLNMSIETFRNNVVDLLLQDLTF